MKKINRTSHPLSTIQPISNTFSTNSHKQLPYFSKPINPHKRLLHHLKPPTKLSPSTLIKSRSTTISNTISNTSKRQFLLRDLYKSNTVKHFNTKHQPYHKPQLNTLTLKNNNNKITINLSLNNSNTTSMHNYFRNNSKGKIKTLSIDNQNEAVLCIQKHWKKYLLKKMGIIQSNKTIVNTPQYNDNNNDEIIMIHQAKSKTTLNSGSKSKSVKNKILCSSKNKKKRKVISKEDKNVCDGLYKVDTVFKNKVYKYKINFFQRFKEIQLISRLKSKFKMGYMFSKSSSNNRICTTTMNNNIVRNSNSNKNIHVKKYKDIIDNNNNTCYYKKSSLPYKTKSKSKCKNKNKSLHINPISA